MRRTTRRAMTAGTGLLAAVLGAATLTGCAPIFGDRCPDFPPGDASSIVDVSGAFGRPPRVDFPTPLIADRTQVSVVIDGEGRPIEEHALVAIEVTQFDPATGEAFAATAYTDDLPALVTANDQMLGEVSEALICATPGSRLVVVTTETRAEPAPADGSPREPVDTATDRTYVLVIDIERVFLGKADGVNQLPLDGMPTVVTAVDGQPGITIAGGDIPDGARTATIKAGAGAAVDEGDEVLVHYRRWAWPAEEGGQPRVIDASWGDSPVLVRAEGDAGYRSQRGGNGTLGPEVAAAFQDARVGDQILVVVPDGESASIIVVDVLGIVEAADEG